MNENFHIEEKELLLPLLFFVHLSSNMLFLPSEAILTYSVSLDLSWNAAESQKKK